MTRSVTRNLYVTDGDAESNVEESGAQCDVLTWDVVEECDAQCDAECDVVSVAK